MPDKLRVLVIAPNLGSELDWLKDVDPRIEALDGNALATNITSGKPLLERADVVLLGYPIPAGIVEQAPRLRWVQHTQAGVSNLRGTDLWDSPVTLTSSRGAVSATGIAEYVMAGAYHFARGLHEATRQKAAGEFSRRGYSLRPLTGATMGIVGLGGIGAEVARLARAAGMRVVATRHSVTSPEQGAEGTDLPLPASQVAELAAASDFLAVCTMLTPATEKMINAGVFAAMKPHAVLINIARGEVLDENALVAALRAGRIAGAVLDVYEGELDGRRARRELVEFPQVVLTPHIAGQGDPDGAEPVRQLFAENLRRYLAGQPLLNLVDRGRGY